jgi:hypothetical protein
MFILTIKASPTGGGLMVTQIFSYDCWRGFAQSCATTPNTLLLPLL